jgi:hypothetical protein
VARRIEGQRWVHRSRGRNPNDLDVVASDVGDAMKSAMKMLEVDAKAMGIDLSKPVPARPTSIELAKIRSTAMDHAVALHDLQKSLEDGEPAMKRLSRALSRAAAIIAPKIARLCVADDADTWAWDAIPNLLLVEHVDAETQSAIEALVEQLKPEFVEAYAKTREKLHASIAHWFASIRPPDRDELDAMIADDRAPSPFGIGDDAEDDNDATED